MKSLQRHKKYKNRDPKSTIAIIQKILKEQLGFSLYGKSFQEANGLFFSYRLLLGFEDWLLSANIGTNGKGMTYDYSRASAYGEMMERIQNFCVLMRYRYFGTKHFLEKSKNYYPQYYEQIQKDGAALPYMYSYDEKEDADDERLKVSIGKYVYSADNEQLFALAKGREHFYVPYYSVKDQKIVSLPFDIIFNNISTNGLCAGNTPKEALIEGLCEILERYVIRKIYFDNLALPRIPREYFAGNEILNKLENLERKEHYIIDIVDCSLGVGIPAVGVVVLTEEKKEYQFHMGVDPSPITALERSLTELFQGRTTIKFKTFDKDLQSRLNDDVSLKEDEMNKTNSASTGHYPLAFFSNPPSYSFTGFDERLGYSDDEDLKLVIRLIENFGFKLYVRNNSFLGFPAYSLYIPGMSELHNTHSLRYFGSGYELQQSKPDEWFQEMFVDRHDMDKIDISSMDAINKAMFYLYKGKKKQAISILKSEPVMSINDMNHDFAYFLETGHGEYSWDYRQWLDELEKGTYFVTNCFHCGNCCWNHTCVFHKLFPLLKKIQNIAIENPIDQMSLHLIFQ